MGTVPVTVELGAGAEWIPKLEKEWAIDISVAPVYNEAGWKQVGLNYVPKFQFAFNPTSKFNRFRLGMNFRFVPRELPLYIEGGAMAEAGRNEDEDAGFGIGITPGAGVIVQGKKIGFTVGTNLFFGYGTEGMILEPQAQGTVFVLW